MFYDRLCFAHWVRAEDEDSDALDVDANLATMLKAAGT